MCGGSGTRLGGEIEKPLVQVGGIPSALRVALALSDCGKFERVLAAVSPKTPATRELLRSSGIEIFETPGTGYSLDLSIILSELKPNRVFVIPADLPLVTGETVAEIASKAQLKPMLSIVATRGFVESLGLSPSVTFWQKGVEYCQSGIVVFDTSRHSDGDYEEECAVIDRIDVAVNVNTKKDLELAEKLLVQRV
jgi:adenosylcobinamide-phosphate guanylyltransferase